MYESEKTYNEPQAVLGASRICKTPTRHFGIEFTVVNSFENGLGVGIAVDGVLCMTKDAAITLISKRIDELNGQWEKEVEKM